MRCIHDQGGEFVTISRANSIKLATRTAVENPQANAICDRVHQTIGNRLRTMLLVNPQNSILATDELNNSHATRASLNRLPSSMMT
jgi:hypothetical protein